MTYRAMVTTEGRFVPREILAHAHRKAAAELNLQICVAAGLCGEMPLATSPGDWAAWYASAALTVDRAALQGVPSYAEIFAAALREAWGWARTIQAAGHGEAPARAVPQFRVAA